MYLLSDWILFCKVQWFFFKERKKIRKHYPFFIPYDDLLRKLYRLGSPYKISKSYLQQKGFSDVHQYGETPVPGLAKIADQCGLSSKDRILELGCGTGRSVFFLAEWLQCPVKGVDWIPLFVERAKSISHPLASFACENIIETSLVEFNVLYLYGTCLPEEVIESLVQRFEKLDPSTKIITVSFSLEEYSSQFSIEKQFSVQFPWGEGEVFLNRAH